MFEYFPENYPWSLGVAASIEMGAVLTEIDDACRGLIADSTRHTPESDEAWFRNWAMLAERLEQQARSKQASGKLLSASELYFRTANYFCMAERLMSPKDPRRLPVYKRGLSAFEQGALLGKDRAERIAIPYEGKELNGWLLLPDGDPPYPCMIYYNGWDSTKEMSYLLCRNIARERGLAMLFMDQEGTGEALRVHGLPKRPDVEVSAGLIVDYLQTRQEISADRIGIMGMSFAGHCAPRSAAYEKRLQCAICIGAFYGAPYFNVAVPETMSSNATSLTAMMEHGMWVVGVDTPEASRKAYDKFTLSGVLEHVTVPLLVIHGENDRQVPLLHAEKTVEEAVNSPRVDLKVFSLLEGSAEHCGIDNNRHTTNYALDWAMEVLTA